MLTIHTVRNGLCDAVKRAYLDSSTPPFIVCPYAEDMTDADMLRFFHETGKLRVWAGGSDRTIYGCEYINWMARAWHDWCHITSGVCNRQHGPLGCFEPTAEYDVADYQCRGLSDTLARIIQIEVSEQARHYQQTGQFVDDQVTFTLHHLRHCKGATHGTEQTEQTETQARHPTPEDTVHWRDQPRRSGGLPHARQQRQAVPCRCGSGEHHKHRPT